MQQAHMNIQQDLLERQNRINRKFLIRNWYKNRATTKGEDPGSKTE